MRYRPRILIVDNDALFLDRARDALARDYEIATARDALEGVDLMLAERFDLLMIDETLPVLDGVELIRIIRGQVLFSQVPIIGMTSTPETILTLGKSHVQGILPKPFSMDELSRTVADALNCSRVHRRRAPSLDLQVSEPNGIAPGLWNGQDDEHGAKLDLPGE